MPRTWIGIIVHSTVRLTVCAAVFFTAAEQTGMLSAQERGRVPRVRRIALRIAHSDDSVSPEESLQQQEALGQYAFRDRQLRMWLSAADRFQKNGQTELALTQLQRILAHYEDAFIHDPNKSSLLEPSKAKISSARALVMQRFEGFGPEIWKVYEILYGGTAQAQLQEAQKNSDIEAVSRVSRHYFHTAAGFEATNWLASWWTDHARYESAARCWGRLLSVNVHRPKITPIHRLKAATVYRRCGLLDRAKRGGLSLALIHACTASGVDVVGMGRLLMQDGREAMQADHLLVVRALVDAGASVDVSQAGGTETALHSAARDGRLEEVVCLAACDKAPVAQINLEYHEQLTDETIDAIIAALRQQSAKAAEEGAQA